MTKSIQQQIQAVLSEKIVGDLNDSIINDAIAAEFNDMLSKEIVRELLLEKNLDADDALVARIWATCHGNPWNAGMMYELLKLAGKLDETAS